MISTWFVFNDQENSWLGDDGKFYENLYMAKEFNTEESAIEALADNRYMVLGWVQ